MGPLWKSFSAQLGIMTREDGSLATGHYHGIMCLPTSQTSASLPHSQSQVYKYQQQLNSHDEVLCTGQFLIQKVKYRKINTLLGCQVVWKEWETKEKNSRTDTSMINLGVSRGSYLFQRLSQPTCNNSQPHQLSMKHTQTIKHLIFQCKLKWGFSNKFLNLVWVF